MLLIPIKRKDKFINFIVIIENSMDVKGSESRWRLETSMDVVIYAHQILTISSPRPNEGGRGRTFQIF